MKCCLTWILQISLTLLIFSVTDTLSPDTVPQNVTINCARFICAFLLHFSVVPEARTALSMMQYSKNNAKAFKANNRACAFTLGMMKISGGVLCEYVNIITILQSESIGDVIKDYIAFGIIAEIDDIVASIMFAINIPDAIEQADIKLDLREYEKSDITRVIGVLRTITPRTFYRMLYLILVTWYNVIKAVYTVFYFYFTPFTIIHFLIYFADRSSKSDGTNVTFREKFIDNQ